MLPDRVSNPGPLTYESGALPIQSIEEKKHVFKMERLAAEQNVKPAVQSKEDQSNVSAETPKIPAFDKSKDEMDSLKGMLQHRRKRIGQPV